MLVVKPWSTEALIRLLAGLMTCVFMGALATNLLRLTQPAEDLNRPLLGAVLIAGFVTLTVALALTRRPWQLEISRMRFIAFLGCVYVGVVLAGAGQKLTHAVASQPSLWQLVIAGVSFQGAALVLICFFLREQGLSWTETFGFRNSRGRALTLGLLSAATVLPLAWLLQVGVGALLTRLNFGAEAQTTVQVLRDTPTWIERLPLGVVAIILAPPAEEALFRGLIYPTIKRAGYPRLAGWGTAVLFATVHWNLPSFLPLILFALVLIWLYEKTGNLLAPIAAHVLFNTLNYVALQLYDRAWSPPS